MAFLFITTKTLLSHFNDLSYLDKYSRFPATVKLRDLGAGRTIKSFIMHIRILAIRDR